MDDGCNVCKCWVHELRSPLLPFGRGFYACPGYEFLLLTPLPLIEIHGTFPNAPFVFRSHELLRPFLPGSTRTLVPLLLILLLVSSAVLRLECRPNSKRYVRYAYCRTVWLAPPSRTPSRRSRRCLLFSTSFVLLFAPSEKAETLRTTVQPPSSRERIVCRFSALI